MFERGERGSRSEWPLASNHGALELRNELAIVRFPQTGDAGEDETRDGDPEEREQAERKR